MAYAIGETYKALLDDNMIHSFEVLEIGIGKNAGSYLIQFDEGYRQWAKASIIKKYMKKAEKCIKKAPGTANTIEPLTKIS